MDKYYLVDAGYMNRGHLIAPYRAVHYHLKEYSTLPPQNAMHHCAMLLKEHLLY